MTAKQFIMLKDLEYDGKWDLSTDEAATIISELWEQRRITIAAEEDAMAESVFDRYGRPLDTDGTQTYEQDNQDNFWKN